ncbi:response regulator transcription factor [Pseudomonas sp. TTU2014-080ASC]|uniref:response regulator transcription factor n=1 Tax=Pseudomonas sp. TTU2014-080ASC TaxID=1729724 RepID=UPI0007183B30|nr:response regulator transcription factor [Pseudomonas sp. TTU2014-080ASC]KRW58474.1 LuxR family transcriptional regulator [Pseudomonas sp. TTU2014-080ASC]
MPKVLIVDDHPAIRLAVRSLLEDHNSVVMAEADNSVDALRLAQLYKPEIVIVEPAIPRLDVSALISRFTNLGLNCNTIILTSQPAATYCNRYIESGANAFITKDEDLTPLLNAIDAVMNGYSLFPCEPLRGQGQVMPELRNDHHLINSLTDRELTILKHLSQGYSNKQIGEMLFLSNKTVSTYKTRIYQKLGLKSVVEMASFSKRNLLIH